MGRSALGFEVGIDRRGSAALEACANASGQPRFRAVSSRYSQSMTVAVVP
jgi:hypothetical protein